MREGTAFSAPFSSWGWTRPATAGRGPAAALVQPRVPRANEPWHPCPSARPGPAELLRARKANELRRLQPTPLPRPDRAGRFFTTETQPAFTALDFRSTAEVAISTPAPVTVLDRSPSPLPRVVRLTQRKTAASSVDAHTSASVRHEKQTIATRGSLFAKRKRRQTEEHKRKRAEALRGRKLSEETRRKMSLAKRGEKNPTFGQQRAEGTRAKIRARALERQAGASSAPARMPFERRLRISEGVRRAWAARRAAAAAAVLVQTGDERDAERLLRSAALGRAQGLRRPADDSDELELRRMIDAQRVLRDLTEEIQRAYRAGELAAALPDDRPAAGAPPKPLSPGADRQATSAYPAVGAGPRPSPAPTPSPSPTPTPTPSITVAEAARAAAEEEAAARQAAQPRAPAGVRPPSPITGLPTDAMAYIYGRWPLKMIDDLMLEAQEGEASPEKRLLEQLIRRAEASVTGVDGSRRRSCPACGGRGHNRCAHCFGAPLGVGICSHCFGSAIELCGSCSGTGTVSH